MGGRGSKLPFGEVMGTALGGVPAYSSDYATVPDPTAGRDSYRASHNGVYTGYKYQCVEYARRWLIHVKGMTFPDVGMAYEVYSLPHFLRTSDGREVPITSYENGAAAVPPPVGAVILWHPVGYFKHTGHIAIVVTSSDTAVCVAEQNVSHSAWPNGQNYSRSLKVTKCGKGFVTVHDNHWGTHALGWVTYE